jgi:hypothetical protein
VVRALKGTEPEAKAEQQVRAGRVTVGEDCRLVTSRRRGVTSRQRGQQQVHGLDRLAARRPGQEGAGDGVGARGRDGVTQLPVVMPRDGQHKEDPGQRVVARRREPRASAGEHVDHRGEVP